MSRPKKVLEKELSEEEQNLKDMAKPAISAMSGKYIRQFMGDTHNEAISNACLWSRENNIPIKDCYLQFPIPNASKTILVSYGIT